MELLVRQTLLSNTSVLAIDNMISYLGYSRFEW